jgi:hypothetical protein
MDYQRFLGLVERFFERAGTVLHKKGEHYSDVEGLPTFVLIDENRGAYYLLEMALPPDHPAVDVHVQKAVGAYAQNKGLDPDVVKSFAALGESIRTVRLRPIDDNSFNLLALQQKYALVAVDNMSENINAFLQSKNIEHQVVPLKGIFTIYFFEQNTSEAIESFFQDVSDTDVPQELDIPRPAEEIDEEDDDDSTAATTELLSDENFGGDFEVVDPEEANSEDMITGDMAESIETPEEIAKEVHEEEPIIEEPVAEEEPVVEEEPAAFDPMAFLPSDDVDDDDDDYIA